MPRPRRTSVGREFQSIRRSLASIIRALARLAPAIEAVARESADSARHRRKLTLSPARRANLRLQGQYMGYVRNLRPKQKARVKAVRKGKGVRAAITLAKSLAGH